MSSKNRKSDVVSTCDNVRKNLDKINHISSSNAKKLIQRFDKIDSELKKLYEHQLDNLSDPIPEESFKKSSSRRRDRSSSSHNDVDLLFSNIHKKVKGSKYVSGSARLKKSKRRRKKSKRKQKK
jgi:hypothetical protein